MVRRIHVPVLTLGQIVLDEAQARHARAVLRLAEGEEIEVFDDAGSTAKAVLLYPPGDGAAVDVRQIDGADNNHRGIHLTVAAAIPKGDRADWMVEKLSELGVAVFIPLATTRGVVLPTGRNKLDRWARIATESAKQSRRLGVMRIDPLTPLRDLLRMPVGSAWCLTPEDKATSIASAVQGLAAESLMVFVGPEGGWTDQERSEMSAAGLKFVRMTQTILRVETAAVAAAAIVASFVDDRH